MTTLLVGTHAMLLAVTLDAGFDVVDWQPLGLGHHYGLAPCGDEVIVKRDDTTFEVLSRDTLESQRTFRLDRGYGQIHQLAHEDGTLYIADTGNNRLGILDMETGRIAEHWFAPEGSQDTVHINSIFPMGGQVLVLLRHRNGPPSEVVALQREGHGVRELDRMATGHPGCHNIFLDSGRLYYNASLLGLFVRMDASSRETTVLELGGHTKGLAASDEHFFIGCSEMAERAMRVHSRGAIKVVDRETLECVAEVPLDLPGLDRPVGNVNEIRLISQPDHCARASHPHPAPAPLWADTPTSIQGTA